MEVGQTARETWPYRGPTVNSVGSRAELHVPRVTEHVISVLVEDWNVRDVQDTYGGGH